MNYRPQRKFSWEFLNTRPEFEFIIVFISRVTQLDMRGNVIAEASAIGRLTSTVLKSLARKEIMNDGELKDGNISSESSIFGRIADQ